jgi:hypothetical protein
MVISFLGTFGFMLLLYCVEEIPFAMYKATNRI